jgi:hypothetical protein
VPAQKCLRHHDEALAAASREHPAQGREESAIGRPKTRSRLLPTENRDLVTQNQQFDVLGELAATAPHEQPQQRREPEIREKKRASADREPEPSFETPQVASHLNHIYSKLGIRSRT